MEVFATDGSFAIGMFTDFKHRWNEDKTLTLWRDGKGFVDVSTNSGTFIEVLDKTGAVINLGGDGQSFYVTLDKKPVTLRYKVLPAIKLSKAEFDKRRQTVTRYLVSDAPYSLKIPGTLAGAIKWLEKKAESIPAASRAKASFEFGTEYRYGESYPNIEISYREPETDKELVTRLQIEAERARIAEEKQRSQFKALKAKFESAP